jgi:hypothetical protein
MIVEWIPQNEYAEKYITPPKPAKNYMPDWYKEMTPFAGGHHPTISGRRADATEKLCMPLFDTFTTGYIQEAWCDLHVDISDNGKVIVQQANMYEELTKIREGDNHIIPKDRGYVDGHLNWQTLWEPRTPKGWSTYYTHPLNQYDVPFRTIDGIIDTDRWWIGGSVPFLLQKGFQGVIPQGTPLYQMFFIKRESWKSEVKKYNEKEWHSLYNKVFNTFYGGYRKKMWVKKSYD